MPISPTALVTGLSRVLAARQQGQIAGTERARAITNEDEDRARTATLSALQQRLFGGQVEHADTRRTQIAQSAARIRANPRYATIADLPDEELVAEVAKLEVERMKPGYRNRAQTEANHDVSQVNAQINSTARDLGAARRAQPKRPALGFETPSDSTAFVGDSSAGANRVRDMQQRLDSLRQVGDSLTAVAGGRTVPRRQSPAQQARLTQLEQQYRNAVSQGADPAKAKAIYDSQRQAILGRP